MIDNVNRGLHWTGAEDAYLREHYPAGTCVVTIAYYLGRSAAATELRARKLRLRQPVVPRGSLSAAARSVIEERYAADGATKLALQLGVTVSVVSHYARARGLRCRPCLHPRDPQQVDTIVSMLRRRNGRPNEPHEYSYRGIGKLLGISHNVVAGIARDIRIGRIHGAAIS